MRLYHFTCSHAADLIRSEGVIKPHPIPRQVVVGPFRQDRYISGLDVAVVWLTDLDQPHEYALGLTAVTLTCDRTAERFEVDVDAYPWEDFARRCGARSRWLRLLHSGGARPWRWWVHTEPIVVERTP